MAQVVPSLTSLPIDSTVAPSAEDIQNHLPSICVDYLSHDWAEEDVWASWRSMTRHKNEIANGVRLENASWRTWWKQRNKLKTISPETLNWLKDSDVTWLYGPLHTAVEPVPPPKVATAEERLGLSRADSSATAAAINATKPILKHRTLSEMLSIPNPSSPILEATRVEGDMEDGDWDSTTGRPALMHTKSDTNIVTKGSSRRRGSPPRGPVSGSSGERTPVDHSLPSSGARTPTEGVPMSGGLGLPGGQPGVITPNTANARKHISFNTFVEQRIAVDDPDEIERIERRTDEGVSDDELDEDEEGAMLEMKSVSSASSVRTSSTRSGRPSISRASSNASSTADHMTTAKIAPTTLKHLGTFPSPSPQLAYAPKGDYASAAEEEAESSTTSSSGNNVTYRHQPTGGYSVSHHENNDEDDEDEADIPGRSVPQGPGGPNSVVSPTWDDEDDYSVGFDYFSGPDLGVGDEYDTKRGNAQSGLGQQAGTATRAVQSHVGGTASYGKASSVGQGTTTVGQPPAAPKWRSGSNSNSTSTSSSGSNTPSATPKKGDNSTSSPTSPEFAIASPPQPGRSILKIRPPGSTQPYEPESPTNTHFNWKPSAATGLGGLDQGVRRVIKEPVAGSLPLYDVNDSYFGQTGSGGSGLETPPLLPGGSPSSPTVAMGSRDGESRGRSAVRTGSTLAERSASRTASTPSASTSPNSSRAVAIGPTTSKQTKQENSAVNKSSTSGLEEHVNEKETAAPQVQRPIGMAGGGMPKDDVELKKEENAKNRQEEEEAQLQAEAVAGQEEREQEYEEDHRPEGYVLDRGSTPTPHSSPQVAIRPLADTSPASLPHVQTVQVPDKKRGAVSAAEQSASTLKAQNSVTVGMGTRRHQRSPSMPSNTGSGSGSRFFRSVSNQHQQRSASQHQGVAEDDGGLMSNLASTAKDLFGALWTYGGQANGNGNNSNNNSTVQANETENGDARSRAESTKST